MVETEYKEWCASNCGRMAGFSLASEGKFEGWYVCGVCRKPTYLMYLYWRRGWKDQSRILCICDTEITDPKVSYEHYKTCSTPGQPWRIYWNKSSGPNSARTHGKQAKNWMGVEYDKQRHIWIIRCPAPLCFYNSARSSEAEANQVLNNHPCPWFGGGTTTFSWSVAVEAILKPIWIELDDRVDIIFSDTATPEEKAQAKAEAKGLGVALAVLMPPFFHAPEEISKEARKRWEARRDDIEYETPGMGRLRIKPPAALVTTVQMPKLDEKELAAIKFAGQSGMFTTADLAKTYGLSVPQVELILKS